MTHNQDPFRNLFGGLDLLNIIRYGLVITIFSNRGFTGLTNLGVFNVCGQLLLIASLLFSAIYTIKGHKLGFTIYFLQIPFRVYFHMYSFSFIADFVTYSLDKFDRLPLWAMLTIITLEIFRFLYSLKKLQFERTKT